MFDFRRAAMGLWRRQLVSARGFCACDGVPSPDAEVSCPWQLLHTSTVSFEAAGAVTQNTSDAVTKSGFRTNQKTMHTCQHCPSHLYQYVWHIYIYIYIYIYIHTCVCACVCAGVHVFAHTHTRIHTILTARGVMDGCTCEHACECVSMHVCMQAWVGMHVRVHVMRASNSQLCLNPCACGYYLLVGMFKLIQALSWHTLCFLLFLYCSLVNDYTNNK